MDSLNLVFSGSCQVEAHREPLAEIKPHELLVEARKSLISTGTETTVFVGQFEPGSNWDLFIKYPTYHGYSMVGEVVAVGSDVKTYRPGDRVAVRQPHKQYTITTAERLNPVPEGVTDEEAAWFGMACIAQIGVRHAEHVLGETVAVVGMGLLGQLVVQYMRLMGASEIIAIDVSAKRLELAQSHGATEALRMNAEQAREEVLRITHGKGVHVAYDTTGVAQALYPTLRLLRRFGRLVILGAPKYPSDLRLGSELYDDGLRIIGAHDGHRPFTAEPNVEWHHPNMTQLFYRFIQRNQMKVADMITHRYSPHDVQKAYQMLHEARGEAMGVLFDWTSI